MKCSQKKTVRKKRETYTNVGDVINSYWILKKRVGTGGFGEVWLASPISNTSFCVAIKFEHASSNSSFLQNEIAFLRKIEMLSSSHRVSRFFPILLDSGTHSINEITLTFMVLEYLTHGDGMTMIHAGQIYPERVIRAVCLNILKGVREIHSMGYVHRDIKPHNFLISYLPGVNLSTTRSGQAPLGVRIVDFGLVQKHVYDAKKNNHCIGTSKYISPAVHTGSTYTYKDDLISLTYVFAELCKIILPWKSSDKEKIPKIKLKWNAEDCPPWINKFLNHVRSIEPGEMPPYRLLESIVAIPSSTKQRSSYISKDHRQDHLTQSMPAYSLPKPPNPTKRETSITKNKKTTNVLKKKSNQTKPKQKSLENTCMGKSGDVKQSKSHQQKPVIVHSQPKTTSANSQHLVKIHLLKKNQIYNSSPKPHNISSSSSASTKTNHETPTNIDNEQIFQQLNKTTISFRRKRRPILTSND